LPFLGTHMHCLKKRENKFNKSKENNFGRNVGDE
jgi:hypothetical protein